MYILITSTLEYLSTSTLETYEKCEHLGVFGKLDIFQGLNVAFYLV